MMYNRQKETRVIEDRVVLLEVINQKVTQGSFWVAKQFYIYFASGRSKDIQVYTGM